MLQPDPAMLRRVFEDRVTETRSRYGATDLRTAHAARDLGLFLVKQGDVARATPALTEAIRIHRTPEWVADLAAVSDPASAKPLWMEASQSADPSVASRAFAALGLMEETAGRQAEAARLYRMALAKEEISSGKESARVAARLNSLALVVERHEAIPMLRRALRIATAKVGSRRLETASIQLNLAVRLLQSRRWDEARRIASGAASVMAELLGPEHPRTLLANELRARATEALGLQH